MKDPAHPEGGICPGTGKGTPGGLRELRRIIGVDPGLASSGWGLVDFDGQRLRHLAHGCIETKADCPRAERLFFIYRSFREILDAYGPAESAVETLYFARNVTSALPVAEARGILSLALAERGIPVREFSPAAIKQAVAGSSQADKAQVQDMVRLLLGLEKIPAPDHAADALAAAICAAHTPGELVPSGEWRGRAKTVTGSGKR